MIILISWSYRIKYQSSRSRTKRPFDTNRFGRGYYKKQNIYAQETNVDFLLTYKNAFGDFDLSTSVGGNAMDFRYPKT